MVSPLAWLLPRMLRDFFFPQGVTSVLYLTAARVPQIQPQETEVVAISDIAFDMVTLVLLTHACRCLSSHVLAIERVEDMTSGEFSGTTLSLPP